MLLGAPLGGVHRAEEVSSSATCNITAEQVPVEYMHVGQSVCLLPTFECCRIRDSDAGETGGLGRAGYPTLEWFMQEDISTRPVISGENGYFNGPFFWDAADNQFMNRAVIYAVEVAQGSYAEKVTGFVRSVRATAAAYDYTWEFK